MKMKCPHCGVSGKADESLSGLRVRCPKCKEIFLVPIFEEERVVEEVVESRLLADDEDLLVESAAGQMVEAEQNDEGAVPSEEIIEISDMAIEEEKDEVAGEEEQEKTGEPIFPEDSAAEEELPEVQPPLTYEQAEKELQAELDAMLAETCSVCGKSIDDDNRFTVDESLYCADCSPDDVMDSDVIAFDSDDVPVTATLAADAEVGESAKKKELPVFSLGTEFSIGPMLKQAWKMTMGIKGSIWGGIAVMSLILLGFGSVTVFLVPSAGAPGGWTVTSSVIVGIQFVSAILSMVFIAGLMNIGVRRVAGKQFSWKMIPSGFSRLGQVAVAGFLMTLLVTIGVFLLILPGIYLAVGYSLTFPLILDQGMGPWEAMEASRKAIHKKWWQVFGLFLLMYLIYVISCIPFGLGMIWTIPMFFALIGVLYRVILPGVED